MGRKREPQDAEHPRSHYCLSCNGLLPLRYDRRQPARASPGSCPHCGVELDPRVRAMSNWVETDQVPGSDLRALWPWLVGGVVLAVAAVALVLSLLG